jgi:hypothetical protein
MTALEKLIRRVVAFLLGFTLMWGVLGTQHAFAGQSDTGARPYQPYGAGAPYGWYERHRGANIYGTCWGCMHGCTAEDNIKICGTDPRPKK